MSETWTNINFSDSVEKAEMLERINEECINIISAATNHMDQFKTARLDMSTQYEALHTLWLRHFGSLNEENVKVDRFSISDLVFVALCFAQLAMFPEWRVCVECDQKLDAVLELIRFVGAQHTPECIWPDETLLNNLKKNIAWIVVKKLSTPMLNIKKEEEEKQRLIKEKKYKSYLTGLSYMSVPLFNDIQNMLTFAEAPRNSEGKLIR